jgi:hypothetical protein
VQISRGLSFRACAWVAALTVLATGLASCRRSEQPITKPVLPAALRAVSLPRDDVLHSIVVKSAMPHLQEPGSPWRQEEAQVYTDVLRAHPADVLVIPFEVQDRGFDRIERSLMTADFATALSRQSHQPVANTYLVARALGEGQRRYQWPDIARLSDAVKASVLIRGYVGHDGHGHLTLTLTVQQRVSTDRPWGVRPTQRDWTGLSFSDEVLPSAVVHRLHPEMLSFVGLSPIAAASAQLQARTGEPLDIWPLSESPSDLVSIPSRDPVDAAARFALLAALAPMNPARVRERLAERGVLLLQDTPKDTAEAKFLRSYLLHLLYRRPAALAALGETQSPANLGLRAVLNGNLDQLEAAVAQSPPPLEALLLEFELCFLKIQYEATCDQSKLVRTIDVARLSRPWSALISNRLSDPLISEAQSNAEIKNLLDDGFPIAGYGLRDLARAALVVGSQPATDTTLDLSVFRHVRRVLATNATLPVDMSEWPNRLDYLQLLEGLGEANLLKAVTRTGFMQGFTNDALQQLRGYEVVYAGHPSFAEIHARLLHEVLRAIPDQRSTALSQEFGQVTLVAAYLEQGQTPISASVLNEADHSSPVLEILTAAYRQDFPMRPWWRPADVGPVPPGLRVYVDNRDQHAITLAELAYAETEVPSFILSQPVLPEAELRTLFDQRFRGSPGAAKVLAHIGAKADPTQADPAVAYREAIKRNPTSWSNYGDLGDWLLQSGDPDGAARAYLSYPGFKTQGTESEDVVAVSNYAFAAGSELYWRGATESARKLYQIAASNDDGSYASISSAGRLALLRGDLRGSLRASLEAAQRYQAAPSYGDSLCMLQAFGSHEEAWAGFNALAERFPEPDVWVSALVGQRMAGTTPEQLKSWLLSDPVKHAHFLGRSLSVDYAILWNSIDRDPPPDLAQLLDEIQGPSRATVESDGLSTARPSWRQEGFQDLLPPSDFRRSTRQKKPVGSPVRSERTIFADAYVDVRAGRYADAVRKFDELAAHYPLDIGPERYVLPYFAYASAKSGDPLHLEEYLHSARVGGDFAAFLAGAFFEGLHGHKAAALDFLKAAFYNRSLENTDPIFSEYRYAEACEWLYKDTGDDAYRQLALEWARMQERVRPERSWIYSLEARLLMPGPERTRALAMTLYLDPRANVVQSLSANEKADLTQWLDKNNPFTHQRAVGDHVAPPDTVSRDQSGSKGRSLTKQS